MEMQDDYDRFLEDNIFAEPLSVSKDEYQLATGETLAETLDITNWKRGVDALRDATRLEEEVASAEAFASEIRAVIRDRIFPAIETAAGAPHCAGVFKLSEEDIEHTHRNVLMNGLVEGCDGSVNLFNSLALQIVQIAVVAVSYRSQEEAWAHRIFKRDIRISTGEGMVEDTLRVLRKRSSSDPEGEQSRRLTEMMRRGIMTLMERRVLAEISTKPWRLGHGHPLPYELLTGSGNIELIRLSLPVLDSLLAHKKFVFVPSDTNERHIKTIGDALEAREYAIVSDVSTYTGKVMDGGFRGDWGGNLKAELEGFLREASRQVVMGVYRASAFAPAQVFYAHADYAHEAARIAIADSSHLEHRGFPLLIEVADQMCRSYFGAETLDKPVKAAFADVGQAFRHLPERSTR